MRRAEEVDPLSKAPCPPRFLCLHGFTGQPDSWDEVVSYLPAELEVLRPSLLGHHGTSGTLASARSFNQEVDCLAAELTARGWQRQVHLAGYSLGGRLALGLLARHPHLFASALLIGAHPGLANVAERFARRAADERLARRLEEEGIHAFIERWQSLPLFATQASLPAAKLAAQRAMRLRQDPAGLAASLRILGLGHMPDWRAALAALECPVVTMVGERDAKFIELAREMAELCNRVSLEIVPGVGHNLLLEAPRQVAAAIRRALPAPAEPSRGLNREPGAPSRR